MFFSQCDVEHESVLLAQPSLLVEIALSICNTMNEIVPILSLLRLAFFRCEEDALMFDAENLQLLCSFFTVPLADTVNLSPVFHDVVKVSVVKVLSPML
jgi:hypothetical protein